MKQKKDYVRRKSALGPDGLGGIPAQSIAQINERKRKESRKLKRSMEKCVDHYTVVIFMTVVTAYSLFFDDIRVLLISNAADDVFFMITFGCLMSFAIEIAISSYCKEDYVGTFFFWLDIISTVSMIPDIPWIWEPIIGEGKGGGGGDAT